VGRRQPVGPAAGRDGNGTKVYDLDSGQDVATLPGLAAVVFAGDDHVIGFPGSGRQALAVVEIATGKERHRVKGPLQEEPFAKPGPSPSLDDSGPAVCADGRWAAVSYENRAIVVWDLTTGQRAQSFTVPGGHPVDVLACHPEGRQVVLREKVGALAPRMRCSVRDPATGQELFRLPERGSRITCAAYSPNDGGRLLTGSEDGSIRLWDADTGLELLTVQDRRLPVLWVAVSPDGRCIAAGCQGGGPCPAAFLIWDARPPGRQEKD
jgi:WD40 repeat protein